MALQVYRASPSYLLELFASLKDVWPVLNFDSPWLMTPTLVRFHNNRTCANKQVYKVLDKISNNFQDGLQHHEYADHEWMYHVGVLFSLPDASGFSCSDAVPSRHMVNALVLRILLTRSAPPQTVQELNGFLDLFMRRFNEAGWLDVNGKRLVPKGRNLKLNLKAKIRRTYAGFHNQKEYLEHVLRLWTSTPFRGYTQHDNEGRSLAFFMLGVFGALLIELRADITLILRDISCAKVADEFEDACMQLLGV